MFEQLVNYSTEKFNTFQLSLFIALVIIIIIT